MPSEALAKAGPQHQLIRPKNIGPRHRLRGKTKAFSIPLHDNLHLPRTVILQSPDTRRFSPCLLNLTLSEFCRTSSGSFPGSRTIKLSFAYIQTSTAMRTTFYELHGIDFERAA